MPARALVLDHALRDHLLWYGNTTNNGPNHWLVTTYPNGEKERVEFLQSPAVGIPDRLPAASLPVNMATFAGFLTDRNTYFWDRNAYAAYAANTNDYTTARLYHWLHTDGLGPATGVEESEQEPLENRVWFNYAGQPSSLELGTSSKPTLVGRVLDDGTTQLRTYAYNALGHVTNNVDPTGRSMAYVYSTNLVDLLEGTSNHREQQRPPGQGTLQFPAPSHGSL